MSTLLNRPTTKFLDSNGYVSHEWNLWLTNPRVDSINVSSISLGSSVISIANGGTGQTTAAAAFNALSPISNSGDMIVGNGPSSATIIPVGPLGSVLTSTGDYVQWQMPAGAINLQTNIVINKVYAARHG